MTDDTKFREPLHIGFIDPNAPAQQPGKQQPAQTYTGPMHIGYIKPAPALSAADEPIVIANAAEKSNFRG